MKGGKPKSQAKNAALSVNKKAAAPTKARSSTKRGKKDKDPAKPKRPPSAFFVFMEEFRVQYKEKHPQNKSVSVVGKAGGDKWKSLSDAEKAPYISKAEKRKADYEKSMKAYNKKQAEGAKGDDEESEKSMSEVNNEDEEDDEEDEEEDDDDE